MSALKTFFKRFLKSCTILIFSSLLYVGAKADGHTFMLVDSCDTITKKEFLLLSESIYKKLDLINSFSDVEMIQAIKIYNTIFLDSSKNLKSKFYIKDFQKKFDSNYRLPLSNNSDEIILTKNSGIYFKKLDVTILNNSLIHLGNYTCDDVFQFK